MNLSLAFPLIFTLGLMGVAPAMAQISEMERLSGFAEHHKNNEKFDKARQKGMTAQFEEEDQWEKQSSRNLAEYRKIRKPHRVDEDGPAARADAADKRAYQKAQEENLKAYKDLKKKQQTLVREKYGLPSEAQELGLDDSRPRYDYRKRAAFGATPKYGKNASPSSSSSGGRFGGGSGSSPSFPPPPSFGNDFGGDDGYIPAPNMGQMEDFGDLPPPPPPPPFDDSDGGFAAPGVPGGYDFPPPPPPPPPFMGDDSAEF